MKSCYMHAVKVSARSFSFMPCYRRWAENFLLYSAVANNGLATTGPNDEIKLNYISPFWAVMLATSDTTEMVNMSAHMEEYTWNLYKRVPTLTKRSGRPTTSHIRPSKRAGRPITMSLPFLTNKKELAPGDLLVLPFDAGLSQICCGVFPPAARVCNRFEAAMSHVF